MITKQQVSYLHNDTLRLNQKGLLYKFLEDLNVLDWSSYPLGYTNKQILRLVDVLEKYNVLTVIRMCTVNDDIKYLEVELTSIGQGIFDRAIDSKNNKNFVSVIR